MTNQTIAAIATPRGEGGIGVIRISGTNALELASNVFRNAQGNSLDSFQPYHVVFGELIDPSDGHCLDQVLITFFQNPKSYTGEDVIEISCHGGSYVTSRVLQLILDQGARLARPGEFTRRAFLNGRIDLSQAEAVADIIDAHSDRALKAAVAQLKGELSDRLNHIYDRVIRLLGFMEAAIDFPEEGLVFQDNAESLQSLEALIEELSILIQSYRQGKIYREGARVTLVGKPNVGKSSLLNALLQEDRAIVTPHPGTTRDILEESFRVRDIHVNIIDSAGLRHNPEMVEKEGIARTRSAVDRADLALVLFDASQTLDADDRLLIDEIHDKPKMIIFNKCDLSPAIDRNELAILLPDAKCLDLSAKTHVGMETLLDAIHDFVLQGQPSEESVVITRERHRELLVQCKASLEKAHASIDADLSEELIALDLTIASENIGAIIGKTIGDDLLDEIFDSFCIGK